MAGRVLVRDPHFPLSTVQALLEGCGVEVEAGAATGADVVGLLVGPDHPLDEGELERLPGLRVVATCSVGYDHIAVAAATRRQVWVCNVPDYCVEEMADSSLALLLALVRGVVALDRSVRAGAWDDHAAGPLRRLADVRLGVIGFGRVGRALASRARGLGLEVWATDPYLPDRLIEGAGVRPAGLDELLRGCTAFSLHLPLGPESEGLIGERELALMPRGSLLVNTARSRLVDLDALLGALERGQLAGAALDALSAEPPTAETPAPRAPTLIVTPHAAWYSPEAEEAVYRRSILSVRAVLEGRVPDDAVNSAR